MALVVNTNIAALNAQRALNKNQSTSATSAQRLASGLRINGAKDDAAGLSIADRMTAQIRGTGQAVRNANDGVSLTQVADAALGTISETLQRMRELSVQSSNASNSSVDRASLQLEMTQLKQQLDSVSKTKFNGVTLLDGSFSAQTFQIGANAGESVSVSMNAASLSRLGTGDSSAVNSNPMDARAATQTTLAMALGDLVINSVAIGASTAASDTSSFSDAGGSAIAKAAAINAQSALTGVYATVNPTYVAGSSMAAIGGAGSALTLAINGVSTGTLASLAQNMTGSQVRLVVVNAINGISGQTGVTAIDTGSDSTGVALVAADGRNISYGIATADASLFATSLGLNLVNAAGTQTVGTVSAGSGSGYTVAYGSYTLSSVKDIVVSAGSGGTFAFAGINAGTYKSQIAAVNTNNMTIGSNGTLSTFAIGSTNSLTTGDITINSVIIPGTAGTGTTYDTASSASATASAKAKAAVINSVTNLTGVTAKASTTVLGAAMTPAALTGNISINGIATASTSTGGSNAAADRAVIVSAINAISGQTGVTAIDTYSSSNGIQLYAADGRNIQVSFTTLTSAATGVVATGTYGGTLELDSAATFTIGGGSNGAMTKTILGIEAGTYGTGKLGQSLSTVSIDTSDNALKALASIDIAIQSVNSNRAGLGALQNRFESSITNLEAISVNLTIARSRITDTDFALEMGNLTKTQVLQQAGMAMLAQANQAPQQILQLLG